jgi:tRNA G46 methylase TrmB
MTIKLELYNDRTDTEIYFIQVKRLMGDDHNNECNSSRSSSDQLCTNDIWNIDITPDDVVDHHPLYHHRSGCNNDDSVTETVTTTAATGTTGTSSSRITMIHTPIPVVTTSKISSSSSSSYTSKKPLWWKRQSGRTISSRQRMAIQEIQTLGLQLQLPTMTQKTKMNRDMPNNNRTCETTNHPNVDVRISSSSSNNSLPPSTTSILNRPQIDWNSVFPSYNDSSSTGDDDEIWLEIGFGLGDNLLCLAALTQSSITTSTTTTSTTTGRTFYVGAEMHKGGIGTICTRMQSAIQEKAYWKDYTLFNNSSIDTTADIKSNRANESITMYSNVRLHMGDGIKLLPFIPDHSLWAVLLTFPDPFMGTNQSSYRILQLDVLDQIRRVLISPDIVAMDEKVGSIHHTRLARPGGRLYLATDHFGYHEWSHEQVKKFNDQNNIPTEEESRNTKLSSMSNHNDNANFFAKSKKNPGAFRLVEPTPDRSTWLPVVSKYEQKGYDEGRKTYLSCWEAI